MRKRPRAAAAANGDLKIETAIAEAAVAAACGVTRDIFGGFLMAGAKPTAADRSDPRGIEMEGEVCDCDERRLYNLSRLQAPRRGPGREWF